MNRKEGRTIGLHKFFLNEKEQIFLDGQEIKGVTAYRLENNSEDGKEPAKLSITLLVELGEIGLNNSSDCV